MNKIPQLYALKNMSARDEVMIGDIGKGETIGPMRTSMRKYTEEEIRTSNDIQIFIANGILEAHPIKNVLRVENGKLVSSEGNPISRASREPYIQTNRPNPIGSSPDGIIRKDGMVFAEGTYEIPESTPIQLQSGMKVRLKGPSGFIGVIKGFNQSMGKWEVTLNDGRRTFCTQYDIVDPNDFVVTSSGVGYNEVNAMENQDKISYSVDEVMKRGKVPQNKRMVDPSFPNTDQIMHRARRLPTNGQTVVNPLAGEPWGGSGVASVDSRKFNADSVINRPPQGSNVQIVRGQSGMADENGIVHNNAGVVNSDEIQEQKETFQADPADPSFGGALSDEGYVIMEGAGQDGMAAAVPLNKMVEGTGKALKNNMQRAVKQMQQELPVSKRSKRVIKKQASNPNPNPIVNDDQNLENEINEFLTKPFHIQKFTISRLKDLNKLEIIKMLAEDENILALVSARIEELKNATR